MGLLSVVLPLSLSEPEETRDKSSSAADKRARWFSIFSDCGLLEKNPCKGNITVGELFSFICNTSGLQCSQTAVQPAWIH